MMQNIINRNIIVIFIANRNNIIIIKMQNYFNILKYSHIKINKILYFIYIRNIISNNIIIDNFNI